MDITISDEGFADGGGEGREGGAEGAELVVGELLGGIALGNGGIGVGLNEEPVDAHRRAGTRQVADPVIIAHSMAGVEDYGQVGMLLNPRYAA